MVSVTLMEKRDSGSSSRGTLLYDKLKEVVLMTMLLLAVGAEAATELVSNGGFESGAIEWKGSYSTVIGTAHSGSYSAGLPAGSIVRQKITFSQKGLYRLVFYHGQNDVYSGQTVRAYLGGQLLSTYTVGDNWTKVECVFDVTEAASYLFIFRGGDVGGSLLDDVSIQAVTSGTSKADVHLTGVTVGGSDLASGYLKTWSYADGVLTLASAGSSYSLAGTNTSGDVRIVAAENVTVTMNDLRLEDASAATNLFMVSSGTVSLVLTGRSTLVAGANQGAIGVGPGAALHISGEGTLAPSTFADYGGLVTQVREGSVGFSCAEDAQDAAKVVGLARPNAEVAAVVSAADYVALFEAEVAAGSGTYTLAYRFDDAVTNEIHQAIDGAAALTGLARTAHLAAPTTTVATVAGLYYGIAGSGDVAGIDSADVSENGWVLGDGTEREIIGTHPADGTDRAFYVIRVARTAE